MLYFTFNTTSEIICFLVSLICIAKGADWICKSIWLYLLITCITEIYGIYLKANHHPNQWPYNILLIFQITFISFFFGNLFSKYIKSKPIIISGLALLFGLYIYELLFHTFFRFYELTYNCMSVLLVIYSLYYFYLLLKDGNYIDLKYSANFWWVSGVLFFYFGSTAVNLFRGKLSVMVTPKHYLTYYIYIVLNMLLYGCWSYSFICKRWLTTTSKS
jgi:hypothetical protein